MQYFVTIEWQVDLNFLGALSHQPAVRGWHLTVPTFLMAVKSIGEASARLTSDRFCCGV